MTVTVCRGALVTVDCAPPSPSANMRARAFSYSSSRASIDVSCDAAFDAVSPDWPPELGEAALAPALAGRRSRMTGEGEGDTVAADAAGASDAESGASSIGYRSQRLTDGRIDEGMRDTSTVSGRLILAA